MLTNNHYQLTQTENSCELLIYGDIGESCWGESISAKEVVNQLADIHTDAITVRINSYGGSVADGLAILNALQRHPAHITTRNEGVAVSIAAYLFMAGDEREAHQNTLYMLHAPWSIAIGNSSDFRKEADVLDKFSQSQISTFTQKTDLDENEINNLLTDGQDHWFTAQEAKEKGFVTSVIEQDANIEQAFIESTYYQRLPKTLIKKIQHSFTPINQQLTSTKEGIVMPKEAVKPDAQPDDIDNEIVIDTEKIEQRATHAERQRVNAINQAVTAAKLDNDVAQSLIDEGVTIDRARETILQKLSESTPTIDNKPHIQVIEDARDRFRQGAIDGMLIRARVKEDDYKNEFRRFGFHDMARLCLQHAGVNVGTMSTDQILQSAITHSTNDFANIYENVMHKTLLDQFRLAPHVWREFCGVGDLTDFRPHNRYKPSSFSDLKGLQENGEIKQVTISDAEKEIISADEKGLIFNLTYKMLKNDDMGAFLSIARDLGRAAARTIENDVFGLLALNSRGGPLMHDGVAMFHANHNNLESAAAIGITSLGLARSAMRKQMDPGQNDFLDIIPAVLLCSVESGDLARQVITSETDITKSNSRAPNPVQNMARVIDTPRITGTDWYLFSAPNDIAAIEVAFVDGMTEPEVRLEEGFNTRGISYRITYDYGTAGVEYRAAVRNPGV